ncbi:MAG: hypothetical protein JW834_04195 [Candidatus Diapherotrites archaeon]|nr:hypothetical protein [Candidatus Diapherotrites archaeon]
MVSPKDPRRDSVSRRGLLRVVFTSLGSAKKQKDRHIRWSDYNSPTFHPLPTAAESTNYSEVDHVNLRFGESIIRKPISSFGPDVQKRLKDLMNPGKEGRKEVQRRAAQRANSVRQVLAKFAQRDSPSQVMMFRLGVDFADRIMDYFNIRNRRIGSEVVVRLPAIDVNRPAMGPEHGMRDIFMYGTGSYVDDNKRISEGNVGISIEVEKTLKPSGAHKFLYALHKEAKAGGTFIHDIRHTIIVTKKIDPWMCGLLGLSEPVKKKRGGFESNGGQRGYSNLMKTDELTGELKPVTVDMTLPDRVLSKFGVDDTVLAARLLNYKDLKRSKKALWDLRLDEIDTRRIWELMRSSFGEGGFSYNTRDYALGLDDRASSVTVYLKPRGQKVDEPQVVWPFTSKMQKHYRTLETFSIPWRKRGIIRRMVHDKKVQALREIINRRGRELERSMTRTVIAVASPEMNGISQLIMFEKGRDGVIPVVIDAGSAEEELYRRGLLRFAKEVGRRVEEIYGELHRRKRFKKRTGRPPRETRDTSLGIPVR